MVLCTVKSSVLRMSSWKKTKFWKLNADLAGGNCGEARSGSKHVKWKEDSLGSDWRLRQRQAAAHLRNFSQISRWKKQPRKTSLQDEVVSHTQTKQQESSTGCSLLEAWGFQWADTLQSRVYNSAAIHGTNRMLTQQENVTKGNA